MANSTPEPMAPDPEELRTAIASGDPVKSMPALAKFRKVNLSLRRYVCRLYRI